MGKASVAAIEEESRKNKKVYHISVVKLKMKRKKIKKGITQEK